MSRASDWAVALGVYFSQSHGNINVPEGSLSWLLEDNERLKREVERQANCLHNLNVAHEVEVKSLREQLADALKDRSLYLNHAGESQRVARDLQRQLEDIPGLVEASLNGHGVVLRPVPASPCCGRELKPMGDRNWKCSGCGKSVDLAPALAATESCGCQVYEDCDKCRKPAPASPEVPEDTPEGKITHFEADADLG